MLAPLHRHLPDEQATLALGAELAAVLQAGGSVHLSGELGSGKTTLARGVIHALGFRDRVKSPTYTLVEPYTDSRVSLYHFDLFRLTNPREWLEAGLQECFDEHAICVVEWPEKAAALLPPPDLHVRLMTGANGGREATLEAGTEAGRECLTGLAKQWSAR